MSIRCKFKVQSILFGATELVVYKDGQPVRDERGQYVTKPGKTASVTLTPVYSTDPNHENKKFWDSTPSGKLEFTVSNADTIAALELGGECYLDLTPAK